ncbi:MAG TPA: hypothetical protein VN397_04805, partial [Candidatus Methylomirabilis sp.]|nr:hypothetical protein [Candidatus Methylomirabilis sp.]
ALENKTVELINLKARAPRADDAEGHGRLLAENARLDARTKELEAQVAELEACLEPSPGTLAFPEMPRPLTRTLVLGGEDDGPELTVTGGSFDDLEVATHPNIATAKGTLAPPDIRVSHLDMRSEKRISAYNGLAGWNELHEGHVVCAIEHDSELTVLYNLAVTVMKRQFRCFDDRGGNVLFRVADLLDPKYVQTLRAAAPSVG